MTNLHFRIYTDEVPAEGSVYLRPTKRTYATDPSRVILPAGYIVPLVNGEATVTIDATVAPDWLVAEKVLGGDIYQITVPDVPDVDYTDLIER